VGDHYCSLLTEAQEIGRVDGRFASAFEPDGAGRTERCLGRTPAEFAAMLWEDRPGAPPTGLVLNAPHWYAAGFRAGLAEARRASLTVRHRPAVCRVGRRRP
jgi:hypothetical protein